MDTETQATTRQRQRTTRYFRVCVCGARHTALEVVTRQERQFTNSVGRQKWATLSSTGAISTFVKCACGRSFYMAPVKGVIKADVACDARCTEAKGHSCECACGGRNHGAGSV